MAATYWCRLLAEHRSAELLPARLEVFRRWPSSNTATHLYQDAGPSWPSYRDEVVATLAESPRDAVLFALLTLKEVQVAWNLAYSLGLDSDDVWERLATAHEKVDPLAVLPVLARLVDNELTEAGAQHSGSPLVGWRRCASWPPGRPRQPELTSSSPSSARRTAVATAPAGVRSRRRALM